MNDLMVSIYCITYNHRRYIEDAIRGFLMQKTNFRYEVWIHDDCSTDGTTEIVKFYENKYPEIIHGIYQNENQYSKKGVGGIDKFILPHMIGKYVAVCEGDDFWCDECKLQKQVDILERNSNYSACVHQTIKRNCLSNTDDLISNKDENGLIDIKSVFLATNYAFQLSSLVCKRDLFVNRPDFANNRPGSHTLSIHLALSGDIYYINEIMSVYRVFSCEHSWTYKNREKSNLVDAEKAGISMLQEIDEYTHQKYEKIIQECINEFEFNIAVLNSDKTLFYSDLYKDVRKEKGISYMFKLYIKLTFPVFYRNIKNLLSRNRRLNGE